MEPNWDWPNLDNWLAEAMWSSVLDAEQNLNSLNLFSGLWSLSLPAPFPTHPEALCFGSGCSHQGSETFF